jgi:hypothetical protein
MKSRISMLRNRVNLDSYLEKTGIAVVELIEQFWALTKENGKRHELQNNETLEERIVDAVNEFSLQHVQDIIQNSRKRFENCLCHMSI